MTTWFSVSKDRELFFDDLCLSVFNRGEPLVVARAWHQDHLLPGHLHVDEHAAYFAFQGKVVRKSEFQVLLGGDLEWRSHSQGDPLPVNAFAAGRTSRNEPLFVGRASVDGVTLYGHVEGDVCFIATNDAVIEKKTFEIMTAR